MDQENKEILVRGSCILTLSMVTTIIPFVLLMAVVNMLMNDGLMTWLPYFVIFFLGQ